MNYYNLDGIKTDIKKDIEINRAYLEAWEKVTFPTKKDGKPFVTMSRNIENATYTLVSYAMQIGEYELTVYTHSNACGYVHDTIKVYELVKYLKDEKMLAKTENYMPKQQYLEQVYKFDLEDIKKAVADHIEYLKEYIADLEKQLENTETVFANFRAAVDVAMKQLEKDTSDFKHKNLFYAVKDTVLTRYPYI